MQLMQLLDLIYSKWNLERTCSSAISFPPEEDYTRREARIRDEASFGSRDSGGFSPCRPRPACGGCKPSHDAPTATNGGGGYRVLSGRLAPLKAPLHPLPTGAGVSISSALILAGNRQANATPAARHRLNPCSGGCFGVKLRFSVMAGGGRGLGTAVTAHSVRVSLVSSFSAKRVLAGSSQR